MLIIAVFNHSNAVQNMLPPKDVSSLRSFLGSVQFYGKFLPNLSTVAEPLYHLTKKDVAWKWGTIEQEAFQGLENLLSTDIILVHFDSSLSLGIACDASNVGIGAVLFHCFPYGKSALLPICQRHLQSLSELTI